MISNKQLQNPIHRETLNYVLISLEDTKLWDRDVTEKSIRHGIDRKRDRKHSLKLFLFLHPLLAIPAFFVGYLVAIYFAIKLFLEALIIFRIEAEANVLLRLTFLFLTLFPYTLYSIKSMKMAPKSPVEYDRKWSAILTRFLSNSKITEIYSYHPNTKKYQEAKRRLTKSIRYYQREGEVIKFFMTVTGSGILMGTLASRDFQVALCNFSATKAFNVNPLGFICLIVSPLIFIYYLKRYYLPIAWMQQIVDQIELLNE